MSQHVSWLITFLRSGERRSADERDHRVGCDGDGEGAAPLVETGMADCGAWFCVDEVT
jgi:hypothetical protein